MRSRTPAFRSVQRRSARAFCPLDDPGVAVLRPGEGGGGEFFRDDVEDVAAGLDGEAGWGMAVGAVVEDFSARIRDGQEEIVRVRDFGQGTGQQFGFLVEGPLQAGFSVVGPEIVAGPEQAGEREQEEQVSHSWQGRDACARRGKDRPRSGGKRSETEKLFPQKRRF